MMTFTTNFNPELFLGVPHLLTLFREISILVPDYFDDIFLPILPFL